MRHNFMWFVLFSGIAGGLAELIWITGYCLAVGTDGWQVARAVTAVFVPDGASLPGAATMGVVIHFLLSVLLAGVFVATFNLLAPRRRGIAVTLTAALAALAAIWAVNFLVILPAVHPAFVQMLPYPVTLLSKLLFGLAMGWSLAAARGTSTRTAANMPMAAPAARV